MDKLLKYIQEECALASEATSEETKHQKLYQLASHLQKKSTIALLKKHADSIDSILSSDIVPCFQGIGFVFLLASKFPEADFDQVFLTQTEALILDCPPDHIMHASNAFAFILHHYSEALLQSDPYRSIDPLEQSIALLQKGNQFMLTVAHPLFLKACLKTSQLSRAFGIVSCIPSQFEKGLTSLDILRTLFYIALMSLGLSQYDMARSCLFRMLVMPSAGVSLLQVSAAKKWILLAVLQANSIAFPSLAEDSIKRSVKDFCNEYVSIAVKLQDGEDLDTFLTVHEGMLRKDGNWGLALRAKQHVQMRAIKKLGSVYSRVGLEKAAKLCGLADVDALQGIVGGMISRNEIRAEIDMETSSLLFQKLMLSNNEFIRTTQMATHRANELITHAKALHRNIVLNPPSKPKNRRAKSNIFPESSNNL